MKTIVDKGMLLAVDVSIYSALPFSIYAELLGLAGKFHQVHSIPNQELTI